MWKSRINNSGIIIAIMVAVIAVPSLGQLTLNNAGFDQTPINDGGWGGIPAGWQGSGYASEQDLAVSSINPPAQSGENNCGLNQGSYIYQGVREAGQPHLIQANKTYKVSVWVGRRAGTEGTNGGILTAFIQGPPPATAIAEAIYDLQPNYPQTTGEQPKNSWVYNTFYLFTGANPPGLGSQLWVGLENSSTRPPAPAQWWYGQVVIDDVSIVSVQPVAMNPRPANDSTVFSITATLQWDAGIDTALHDVYLGESLAEVNNATTSTTAIYKGSQSTKSYTTIKLVPGKTYYWRIDEISGTNVFKGDVWKFTILGAKAYNPTPSDGAIYQAPNIVLAWSRGVLAQSHDVYLGTSQSDVNNATTSSPEFQINRTDPNYAPATPSYNMVYYWRIDERNTDSTVTKGDVWQFKTEPTIPFTDPNLVGWWKLDEGVGNRTLDSSGRSNHGNVMGNLQWVVGQDGYALEFYNLQDEYVECGNSASLNITAAITVLAWVKTNDSGNGENNPYITKGNTSYALRHNTANNIEFSIYDGTSAYTATSPVSSTFNGIWHHIAGTYDGINLKLYIDGVLQATTAHTGAITGNTFGVSMGRDAAQTWCWYNGVIDDVRIYSRALTEAEIKKIVIGNPLQARSPKPANGAIIDIEHATPLSWSPGETAVQHDVYFGTDQAAVESAGIGTTGIYRDRHSSTSYNPPETLNWGQRYYWRIDEYNTDMTITKGSVWTFTTADYLVVDDFEDYNNFTPDRIFQTWLDGVGYSADQYFPVAYNGNGSGAVVGHDIWTTGTPYTEIMETVIIHGGKQSMPVDYNNTKSPYVISETERTWTTPQDWTRLGVKTLTIWFRGLTAPGSFQEGPGGTFAISASGTDIWDVTRTGETGFHDEFRFAYKNLNGDGSILLRVDSVENTDGWAKAGVMIRETLADNSPHAMVIVSPGNGVAFQYRTSAGGTSTNVPQTGVAAPHWVKITRTGDTFTAEHSADGVTWNSVGTAPSSTVIPMAANVYIGIAVTAHNDTAVCHTTFSNITTSGTGPWQSKDIGIKSNSASPLYVDIKDSAGKMMTVLNSDPNAVQNANWQEWNIPLSQFTSVNLRSIKTMYIGVGNGIKDGTGSLYFDDIRLYPSRCMPSLAKPAADLNSDCTVNYLDLDILAGDWLLADEVIVTTPPSATGLMGHWKLDGNANDSSGNGRNGTVNGSPQWVPVGHIDGALSFDGADDYVSLPIGPAIASMNSCTIATWVNFSNSGGAWQRIFDFGSDPNIYMFLSPRTGTTGVMRFAITTSGDGSESQLNAPSTLATGWHHVAVMIDGTSKNMQIYLDGASVISGTTAVLPKDLGNTTQNWLGRSQFATDAYFTGSLDDFRIYNRVLSKSEVAYLGDSTPADGQIYIPLGSDADLYSAEPAGSKKINLKDFAVLASGWLEEKLWP